MPENNQILSVDGQLVGMPLAGPESFSQEQLAYLKRSLSVDETLLFSTDTFSPGDTQQTYNLSESPLNFERIAVYVCRPVTPAPWMGYIEFYPAYLSNAGRTEIGSMGSFNASGTIYLTTYTAINVLTTQWKDGASRQATIGGAWDSGYFSHIYRIVGIHRISGGN